MDCPTQTVLQNYISTTFLLLLYAHIYYIQVHTYYIEYIKRVAVVVRVCFKLN